MVNFKLKKSIKLKLSILLSTSFILGIFLRPYLGKLKLLVELGSYNINTNIYKNCPKKIDYLPEKSIIIIGHAYGSIRGSQKRGNNGIAPKIEEFYKKNKKKIDTLIFSGDILRKPNIEKWNNFYSKFDENTKIYISPGNHDVGGKNFYSPERDIFNLINQHKTKHIFPFTFSRNNSLFIIADTNSKIMDLDKVIKIIKNNQKHKNIFIIMHHVLIKELKYGSNGEGKHGFIKNSILDNKISKITNKKLFFIYGDGGVSKYKPRIKCFKSGNTLHIVNGIGEINGDIILLIKNGQIYRMEI